jgi:aminopeptidase N
MNFKIINWFYFKYHCCFKIIIMKKIVFGVLILLTSAGFSQKPDSVKAEAWKKIYRASATKINDLVHTKLDVSFDYAKSWMYGKEWITLHPHFYPSDSLNLDAKSMRINEVSVVRGESHIPLKYSYDSLNLHIILDKTYRRDENYVVYIDYVAMPDDIKQKGSQAISGGKGLYFINPTGKDRNKPTQIWTQGETESNSGWFPTIDKPNQKTTDEIIMTVPDKYKTLSNGMLKRSRKNVDGTRTDTWRMDLPHAPYLMMMAVGEYSVIKDSYEGKEVSYYVEKEYAPVARKIFGLTPEMISFYSKITGVDYPWPKYAQVVVRDYISGAMENTTATVHGSFAQQDARQLIDGNSWEDGIAHELFHQWFGDYVTTESWSNLTLNESLADLSETFWEEYKHGKDAGDEHNYNAMQNYLQSGSDKDDLVRFYYRDREDMFDAVSYQKGGRILNMLKNYIGDSAFYRSLNLYLRTKKFGSAEAHDLRLAFEDITGQDLNWFWNEWYFGSGHPKLDISYSYDMEKGKASVIVKQTQPGKIFKVPVSIDIYHNNEKKRYNVWLENQADTFSFPVASRPDLMNFDGDKILLCVKTDRKSMDDFLYQYKYAGLYADRREALDFAAKKQAGDPVVFDILKCGLADKYHGIRRYTLQFLNTGKDSIFKAFEPVIASLAKNDPDPLVRAGAIEALGRSKNIVYKPLYLSAVNDSSYTISGNALIALGAIDSTIALEIARKLTGQNAKGSLESAINDVLFKYSPESEFNTLAAKFEELPFGNEKFDLLQPFSDFLKRVNDTVNFKKGVDLIVSFRDTIPEVYRHRFEQYFNGMILNGIMHSKQSAGLTAQADYVTSKIPARVKPVVTVNLSADYLQKLSGDYDYSGTDLKVIVKNGTSLNLEFPGESEIELNAVSKIRFALQFMEGYYIDFTFDDKGVVTGLTFVTPDGEVKATKKQ